jgi:hypothetical protein
MFNRPSLIELLKANKGRPVSNRPVEKAPLRYRLKCEVCEGEFRSSRLDSKYCSNACRQQAYRWR